MDLSFGTKIINANFQAIGKWQFLMKSLYIFVKESIWFLRRYFMVVYYIRFSPGASFLFSLEIIFLYCTWGDKNLGG